MNLRVGTSGYCYKEWKGTFYPEDMAEKDMLPFYGERFGTVEINNTFYRMPKPSVLEHWSSEVPDGFQFVLKASRSITHIHRLKECDDSVAYLLKMAATLKEKLGPILFQLMPQQKKDAQRLATFMNLIPKGTKAAFEFRNESWFDDEVFGILRDHNASLCIAEAEDDLHVPFVSTADWGYLRLRRLDYGTKDLREHLQKVREQNWSDSFVFFKHEEAGKGPAYAIKFLELAGMGREKMVAGSRASVGREQEEPAEKLSPEATTVKKKGRPARR